MKTFKNWCKGNKHNKEKMKGIVIYDYSLDKHLKFLKFHSSFPSRSKLIIAYNPAEKVIFLIRKTKIKDLEDEMKASTIDVMKFVLLHFEILKNSGVRVINLLVTDEEFTDLELGCEACKNQVISIESVKSSDQFQNWLMKKNEKFSISVNYENINENFNRDFCAQLLFFLATHEIQTLNSDEYRHYDSMLPSRTEILREQVEEAKFLTNEHLKIIYSERKHQIVFGWYNSGIIAVARNRAELISKKLSDDEVLYFICCDSKSQLFTDQENNPKMNVFWNSNLRNLCDIIKEILEQNKTKLKLHLVAVEYDLEELNNKRLAELRKMLMENDQLKDSYIFLGCHPIQKERKIMGEKYLCEKVMGEEYSNITKMELNLYGELKMREEKLHYNKTNTLGINTLIAFIADELENKTTVCKILCNTEPKAKMKNHDDSFPEPKLKRGRKRITFDEQLELYNVNYSLVFDNKASDTVTVQSGFKYIIKPSKSEGNKELVKPSLVEIKYTEHSKKFMILNLKTILYQIISMDYREQKDYRTINPSKKEEKHVILHFDIENDFPEHFKIVFHLMDKKERVTNEYKEFIQNKDKTILICNYRAFRGLTNSSVIVVLELFLYHQKFYVLESLSRASVVLDIIVLNMSHAVEIKNDEETFQSTINKWRDSNKVQSLFSPFKFIDCEVQKVNERNTSEEKIDIEKIEAFLAESQNNVSNDKTDFKQGKKKWFSLIRFKTLLKR